MRSLAATTSLQNFVESKNLVEFFYNDTLSPHSRNRSSLNPAPAEWSNWRDEQRAWRETAILFDQSHHMPELFLRGPDALRLLGALGINSFKSFKPGKAKQYVACNPRGQMIGECVVYYTAENEFELVSGMQIQNWVHYNAETGNYDVEVERDNPSSENQGGRTKFRFQLDGPNAEAIFKELLGGEAPEIAFFNTAPVSIAGCAVTALRHGMAGHRCVELSGRFGDGATVCDAILRVGKRYGLRRGGTIAYFSA